MSRVSYKHYYANIVIPPDTKYMETILDSRSPSVGRLARFLVNTFSETICQNFTKLHSNDGYQT